MIDFHCHLDLYPEPLTVAMRSVDNGVQFILSVTNTPSAFDGTRSLANNYNNIETALGLHPQIASERKTELSLFDKLLPCTSYVGEIGLDGETKNIKEQEDQRFVFNHILKSCSSFGGKILSIHSRQASTEVLNDIKKYPDAGCLVLHWFSGNSIELQKAIDLGCWFSVGPSMLNTNKGRLIVSNIPKNKLLTETDGPFAQMKNVPLMPWDSQLALRMIASIWNTSIEHTKKQIELNLHQLHTHFHQNK